MICINCGTDDNGKLCSNCGQPLEVKRITFKEQWHDFVNKMYGFDGQFLRTVKDLTIRPGYVAREFIKGNRVRYFGPIGYYFFMIALMLLVLSMFDMNYVDYMKAMQDQLPMQEQNNTKLGNDTRSWVADNIKLIAFIIPPFIAFASQKFFFRKQGLNFLEHSVPIFYALGHWYWVTTIEVIVFRFTGHVMGAGIQSVIVSLYVGFVYVAFVPTQPKWKAFLKGVGLYFVGFMLMMITAVVIGLVGGITWAMLDPDSFDAIRPSRQSLPK